MKNTETRKTAKTILGLLLVVGLMIGAFFGLELPYGVEDVIPEENINETTAPTDETNPTDEDIITPPVEDEITTLPTVEETPNEDQNADEDVPVEDVVATEGDATQEDVPQDSTPTEDNENVDNSVDTEVTEPTEDNNTVTEEGDVENA